MEDILACKPRLAPIAENINKVAVNRVSALVAGVTQWLVDGESGLPFSDSDLAVIQRKFQLPDAAATSALVDAIIFLFRQAAYAAVSRDQFATTLAGVGFDADHAAPILDGWATHGKSYQASLRNRTLGGPRELKWVAAETAVAMAQDGGVDVPTQSTHDTLALLQLGLSTPAGTDEKLTIQMDADSAYSLFQAIDQMAVRADTLQS
eukprot:TRINITY_DN23436_c0_g1_i1.p1 TRINITY_DN23436_c0_g1~~TRINITY_DN23436_c0_g1_i1.p1  ORF type:complete len:207 (+),score=34.61 TRINITY_DN23436_c0_g1_i1:151-771(+)